MQRWPKERLAPNWSVLLKSNEWQLFLLLFFFSYNAQHQQADDFGI